MSVAPKWQEVLAAVRPKIRPDEYTVWFGNLKASSTSDDTLVISVENRLAQDWIASNYADLLAAEAGRVWGRPVRIEFARQDDPTCDDAEAAHAEVQIESRGVNVNASMTFDNFVVGECNKFAHAAAIAVANGPARSYNPLFIYGSTGLGKTHLMHAIANHVLASDPEARVVYVTSEDFMNDMINSIANKTNEDFRNKYRRSASVLLVDDVQFWSGKEATQQEFFHTFNALHSSHRQIVLSADVPPSDIDKLHDRLRTRLEGGLPVDMQAPDRETLLAIIERKSSFFGLALPPELADALADRAARSIREVEGVLTRIQALQQLDKQPLDLAWARQRLPDVFAPPRVQVTVSGIIEAVARFHSLRSADLTGAKRNRALAGPRHIAMYLAREHVGLSFPELGREFGGRDHSTIQHGYRKIQSNLNNGDNDLAFKIRMIEQDLLARP